METKPHIVVLTSRFPYPLEKGDKLRAYHQIRELSRTFDITLISTSDVPVSEDQLAQLRPYCKQTHQFQLTHSGLVIQLILSLFTRKPVQVHYFYRKSIHRKIRQIIHDIQPAAIYCQLVRMAEYVKHEHLFPKTLDYMDALSKGMERRIETEPWYKSWFYKRENKRLRAYERRVFDYFEHHTIISAQDLNYISHPDNKQIQVVPNGVDESFFEDLQIQKDHDLLFTGNFSYAPNIDAAVILVEQILPLLNQRGYYPKLLLSGANPTPRIKALQSEFITVTGWVDDIRQSYQRARIFVAPLFIGSGLQNKLLEAMASRLPCITTPLVNNALHGTDYENLLLAENINEFVEKITELTENDTTFNYIVANGQTFIKLHYSWEKQTSHLVELLHS